MANTMTDERAGVALLIDGENVFPDILVRFFDKIKSLGDVRVRLLIGNFRVATAASWKGCEERYALSAVQSTAYVSGKNTSDSRLVIEAMKVFYETEIRTFVIMSSDSDFTQLALFLREKGVIVIGIGLESAPLAWQCGVSAFWAYRKSDKPSETLSEKKEADAKKPSIQVKTTPKAAPGRTQLTQEKTLHRWITSLCKENQGPKGWTLIAKLDALLNERFEIDYRQNWQVENLAEFLSNHPERYQTNHNLIVKPLV